MKFLGAFILLISLFSCQSTSTQSGKNNRTEKKLCSDRPIFCYSGNVQCAVNSDGCESCGCIQSGNDSTKQMDEGNNRHR